MDKRSYYFLNSYLRKELRRYTGWLGLLMGFAAVSLCASYLVPKNLSDFHLILIGANIVVVCPILWLIFCHYFFKNISRHYQEIGFLTQQQRLLYCLNLVFVCVCVLNLVFLASEMEQKVGIVFVMSSVLVDGCLCVFSCLHYCMELSEMQSNLVIWGRQR